jgi:hypothetical protein
MSNSCEGSTIHGVNIVVIVIGIGVSYTGFLVVNGDGFFSCFFDLKDIVMMVETYQIIGYQPSMFFLHSIHIRKILMIGGWYV